MTKCGRLLQNEQSIRLYFLLLLHNAVWLNGDIQNSAPSLDKRGGVCLSVTQAISQFSFLVSCQKQKIEITLQFQPLIPLQTEKHQHVKLLDAIFQTEPSLHLRAAHQRSTLVYTVPLFYHRNLLCPFSDPVLYVPRLRDSVISEALKHIRSCLISQIKSLLKLWAADTRCLSITFS